MRSGIYSEGLIVEPVRLKFNGNLLLAPGITLFRSLSCRISHFKHRSLKCGGFLSDNLPLRFYCSCLLCTNGAKAPVDPVARILLRKILKVLGPFAHPLPPCWHAD